MNAAEYAKEYKKFGIQHARQAKHNPALSNVVVVADDEGRGFTYITFSEEFVEAVGRVMPRGVSGDDPCYLKVLLAYGGVWRVYSSYLDHSAMRLLWESTEKPEWVKQIRRPK